MKELAKSSKANLKKSREEELAMARQEGRENKKTKRRKTDKGGEKEVEYVNSTPNSKKTGKKEEGDNSEDDLERNSNRPVQKGKAAKGVKVNPEL